MNAITDMFVKGQLPAGTRISLTEPTNVPRAVHRGVIGTDTDRSHVLGLRRVKRLRKMLAKVGRSVPYANLERGREERK